jgi:hypothetical protein
VKPYIKAAGIALAAYAIVSYVQRNVMAVPVVGAYLPK